MNEQIDPIYAEYERLGKIAAKHDLDCRCKDCELFITVGNKIKDSWLRGASIGHSGRPIEERRKTG